MPNAFAPRCASNRIWQARICSWVWQSSAGEFQDSAKQLEAALATEPKNREAFLFLLRDQLALGRFRPEVAARALGVFTEDAEVNYTIGLTCLERIREISREANELGPESSAFIWLSLRRAEERQQAESVTSTKCKRRLVASRHLIREYDALAGLLKRCFDAVLTTTRVAAAHSIRGYLHESRNEVEEALAEYRAASDHFAGGASAGPECTAKRGGRGVARGCCGRYAKRPGESRPGPAISAGGSAGKARLRFSRRDCPSATRATPMLGPIWVRPKESSAPPRAAVQALQKALQIDPSLNQVHYQLAMLYRQKGNEKLAMEELQSFKANRGSEP